MLTPSSECQLQDERVTVFPSSLSTILFSSEVLGLCRIPGQVILNFGKTSFKGVCKLLRIVLPVNVYVTEVVYIVCTCS